LLSYRIRAALPLLAVAAKTYLAQYEFYSEYFPARGETVSENQNLCSHDDGDRPLRLRRYRSIEMPPIKIQLFFSAQSSLRTASRHQ
jgi:hypothetical protein